MGGIQKLLGMKGKVNPNYYHASPIAKTKSLKNVFIRQNIDSLKKKQMKSDILKGQLTAREIVNSCNQGGGIAQKKMKKSIHMKK